MTARCTARYHRADGVIVECELKGPHREHESACWRGAYESWRSRKPSESRGQVWRGVTGWCVKRGGALCVRHATHAEAIAAVTR